MKKLFLLIITIALASIPTATFAETSQVIFEGEAEKYVFIPDNNPDDKEWTNTDLFDGFKGVLPGSTVHQKIIVKNNNIKYNWVKIYIRAKLHDEKNTLSPEVMKTGASIESARDFLSQLSMEVTTKDKILFSAPVGDLGSFATNVLIGEFEGGSTTELDVALMVPKELGNEYLGRIGEVDWIFTAEVYQHIPQVVALIVIAAIIALLLVIFIIVYFAKRKKKTRRKK